MADMIALTRRRRSLCFLALCREAWDVIRKLHKAPDKKEDRPESLPRDYLWSLGKGVLYGHSERSGVLCGSHMYVGLDGILK